MSRIHLLDKLLTQYKVWSLKYKNCCSAIKSNILQEDQSTVLEEKFVSIAISSVLVYIGVSILSFFGLAFGGVVAGVIIFFIGWSLSKLLNKKIFGSKREYENLKNDEKVLFEVLDSMQERHHEIVKGINAEKILVNFTDYVFLQKQFERSYLALKEYKVSHLAYKYRAKHPFLVAKYKKQMQNFEEIYASKKRRALI